MSYQFFLPWKHPHQTETINRKQLYFHPPKEPFLSSLDYIHHVKKPFFSMPNPQGTLQLFIHALRRNEDDVAKGYICKELLQFVDIEEFRDLFQEESNYQFFSSRPKESLSSVGIAVRNKQGATQMLVVYLVKEPNRYGKWKICQIEKQ
jgi:hypothetical protein